MIAPNAFAGKGFAQGFARGKLAAAPALIAGESLPAGGTRYALGIRCLAQIHVGEPVAIPHR